MDNIQIESLHRIPRPKGATNLARSGLTKELQSLILKFYLIGTFPFQGYSITPLELHQYYGIPQRATDRAIRMGTKENLFSGDKDLLQALQEERSFALSGVLNRIGDSDRQLDLLTRRLQPLVLDPSSYPDPFLIKEFNATIANQVKLTETQLKALAQIHSFLQEIPLEQTSQEIEEAPLTRAEILEQLSSMELDTSSLKGYIENKPNLHPIPEKTQEIEGMSAREYSKDSSHSFNSLEEEPRAKIAPTVTILPK